MWLATLVLTASVDLTVERHTFRFSGCSRTSLALLLLKGALALLGPAPRECYGAATPPRIKDDYCDFGSHLHKLTATSHAHAFEKVPGPGPLLAA